MNATAAKIEIGTKARFLSPWGEPRKVVVQWVSPAGNRVIVKNSDGALWSFSLRSGGLWRFVGEKDEPASGQLSFLK